MTHYFLKPLLKRIILLITILSFLACPTLADDQVFKKNEQTGEWELAPQTEPEVNGVFGFSDGSFVMLPYSSIKEIVENQDPVLSCSLLPLSFYFYEDNDEQIHYVKIIRGEFVDLITSARFDVEGSGPCRHRIWSFDYNGPITIRELGCYGEIHPPKDAVGEISFDSKVDYKRSVFCY